MELSGSKQLNVSSFLAFGNGTKTAVAHSKDLAERVTALSLAGDFVVSMGALTVAFWIRFGPPLGDLGVLRPVHLVEYANYFISGALLMAALLAYRGMYQAHALLRFRHSTLIMAQSIILWFVGFLGFCQLLRNELPISRLYVLLATGCLFLALPTWRFFLNRVLHRPYFADALSQKVLIVGWNENASRLYEGMTRTHTRVYRTVGCLRTNGGEFVDAPIPFLGNVSDLERIIQSHSISTVMVTDLTLAETEIANIARICERELVEFKITPCQFQILVSGLHLQSFDGIPVLGVSKLPLDNIFNVAAKRLMDIIGATVGLLLSVPLIAIFGIIVYRESPGPIFYLQRRSGRNGRIFNIVKIRSMRLDAEKDSRPGWSTAVDPRRLKIGGFMRKWNIDEVPQFWNVLKGEMSLVGPRPERPELIQNFRDEIPHYQARHNVKPGITGWAQVKGLRGDTDLGERIKCDLFYLENWSLVLDFQIMLMTFVGNKNAA